jgi:hypothetical protein
MKKVLALVVAFGLGFALMGCGQTETTPTTDETTPVVENTVPAAEIVEVTMPAEMPVTEEMPAMDEMNMDAMNGEMVMDEMIPAEMPVMEEIVETPAE